MRRVPRSLGGMPDSYGKRQRNMQKAKKFADREERRAARKQQKADEAAGITPPEDPEASSDESVDPEHEGSTADGSDASSGGSDDSSA